MNSARTKRVGPKPDGVLFSGSRRSTLDPRPLFVAAFLCLLAVPLRAEDIRIDLDRRDDKRVKSRIDASGFSIRVELDGNLQRQEPTTITIDTQQKGRWLDPKLEAGRYLKTQFDAEKPQEFRIESTLKFDLAAGERRFQQERDAVQKEAGKRTGGRDGGALAKAKSQVTRERIAAIREENIKAGADKRGKATPHTPPLPRQPLDFEKPAALEGILKEQCYWQSVAEAFKASGFPPPDEKEHPEFAASQTMAEEVRQAMMGNKITPKFLSQSQFNALADGSHYQLSCVFIPELPTAPTDTLWKTAPAVRLADGVVKRAELEGSLSRDRGQTVEWWRVECDTPVRVQAQMTKGDGDCFWNWVDTPAKDVRYIRVLLHSPSTRYRMTLSLSGASKGEEITLYDGPFNPPLKGPF